MLTERGVEMAYNRPKPNSKQRIVAWSMAIVLVGSSVVFRIMRADYWSFIFGVFVPVLALGLFLINRFKDRPDK
jgi:hypothetical protein